MKENFGIDVFDRQLIAVKGPEGGFLLTDYRWFALIDVPNDSCDLF